MAAAITVEHVSKGFRLYDERNQSLKATVMRRGRARFEEFVALDDVSLEVAAGETFGFIGENGSGKSTLLKCIARILRPDSGSISVEGKISALLELGAGFHPELSGRENVYLNGSILGLSKKELDQRFDDIVEFAGLERFIDTAVKNYSSGMYVRLGFSVAINVSPDVLLVDEVLAVGDEAFQRRCADKFAEFKQAGKTIVIVSHGLGSVRTMCDRVLWLEHGVARMVGDSSEVIDGYLGAVHHVATQQVATAAWGSGEAKIERVDLLGPDGKFTDRVRTGDRVTFRLHYSSKETIHRPLFCLAISTNEGVLVTAPTSREFGLQLDRLASSGVIEIEIPSLQLLPGAYEASVSLWDHSNLHEFHHRQRALRFDVLTGTPVQRSAGVLALPSTWRAIDGPATEPLNGV
jgi:ABC-type polysaccharide/polyol phosphate transport system ATPase subunit